MTIHVYFMYPETKGRSLEEIEEIFAAGHVFSAYAIPKNIGFKSAADIEQGESNLRAAFAKNNGVSYPLEKESSKDVEDERIEKAAVV